MKRIGLKALPWVGMFLFSAAVMVAQEVNVVHYGSNGGGTSKRPDFSKALVGIQISGAPAATARYLFSQLGAGINETPTPCAADQDIVCVTIQLGKGQSVSASGYTSGYGTRGGSYSSGSFSGTNYPVTAVVTLIKYNGGKRTIEILGEAQETAPQGTGSSSSYGYGRNGGGGITTGGTSTLASTYDRAAENALTTLLSKHAMARFLTCGDYEHWYKGADVLVRQAFGK